MIDQVPLFPEELPVYPEDLEKAKKERPVNCLQDMLLELMDERKISLAQIQKATNIPWGSLAGWHSGDVKCQLADKNLLRLAQFFNVSLEYLVYGIGDSSPPYQRFEGDNETE